MAVTVRPLQDDEIRLYLEIHERAIRGLAAGHYSQDDIEGWVVLATDENLRRLTVNADSEIRLIAELDGRPVGIGVGLIGFVGTFRKADPMSSMAATARPRRTRPRFTDEFKAGAVRLVLDEGKTVGQLALELDLTESALRPFRGRAIPMVEVPAASSVGPSCEGTHPILMSEG